MGILQALKSVKMAEAGAEEAVAGAETVETENNLESQDLWGDILDTSEGLESADGDVEQKADEVAEEVEEGEEIPAGEEKPEATEEATEEVEEADKKASEEGKEQPQEEINPAQEMTPEQLEQQTQQLAEARGKVLEQLSDMYALTEEESETLQLEPEKVLPKLAAQLHLNITEALQEGIKSQLPQMMRMVKESEQAQEKSVGAFYTQWPALKDSKYQATVVRVVQAYRNANPTASQEQVIREGGAAAMVALQLPLPGVKTDDEEEVSEVEASAPPVQPIQPGASSVPKSGREDNAFTSMFLDVIEEDI